MKKVVINTCFGGFGLSHAAVMRYAELSGFTLYPYLDHFFGVNNATLDTAMVRHYSRVPVENLPRDKDGDPVLPNGARFSEDAIDREDPILVRVVEEMGAGHRTGASGPSAHLAVVEIPDDVDYTIEEYDGCEHIAEAHRTWR